MSESNERGEALDRQRVSLSEIVREWGRIGCIGFGGPPAHIALLRKLCVDERQWLSATEFEDGVAATNLLPGPASTQLAIFCAWRLRGAPGALLGGVSFIVPGLVVILALSSLFLERHPPVGVQGAAAGAGAAVGAVALNAAMGLAPASWRRIGATRADKARWTVYGLAGATAAITIGPFLALVLLAMGLAEVASGNARRGAGRLAVVVPVLAILAVVPAAGIGSVAWEAFKVGALSYGGGFVIIPLMQTDAVHTYHWMSSTQFLNAVALGQVTPGPVVQTVAVVGYAADKIRGGLLASFVAFTPSFVFVLGGARRFDTLRTDPRVQDFLTGAGPAAIGAIAGSSVTLALAIAHLWQIGVLAAALVWLVALRKSVVIGLVGAGVIGAVLAVAGLPVIR